MQSTKKKFANVQQKKQMYQYNKRKIIKKLM
jgi:hypothetical protein